MLLLSASWGIMAMCWAMVIYTQIAIFINTYYTGKLFHLGYWEQLTDFFPYLVLALLANIPAYLLRYTFLPAGMQILLMKHVLSDFYKHKINKVSGGSGK